MTNRLKNTLVYQSGPMDRVSWKQATSWRDDIKPFLFSKGIGVLDPCDKACAFGVENESTKETIQKLKQQKNYKQIREIMKPICAIDLRMVDIAHFVILYIDLDVHMTGSYHEAFVAVNQKKPVLTMCKQGKENIPNWLFGVIPHEMMFSNWEELRKYIYDVDTSENPKHYNRWRFLDMDHIYCTKENTIDNSACRIWEITY